VSPHVNEVRLSIPARPDFVHVLRSVMAAVAAQLDFSFDDIEDMRLAVDEACAYLLGIRADVSTLNMRILRENGTLEVVTSIDAGGSNLPPADAQQTVMWHILAALTDEARFEDTGGGPGIRLTKRVHA
jgi:serine/threonine-protein kinase RsbW